MRAFLACWAGLSIVLTAAYVALRSLPVALLSRTEEWSAPQPPPLVRVKSAPVAVGEVRYRGTRQVSAEGNGSGVRDDDRRRHLRRPSAEATVWRQRGGESRR